MCGIAGIYRPDADWDSGTLIRAAVRTMAHRGPDDEGFFASEEMALGACRLSVQDLRGGRQPVWNEAGTVCAVANCELYGFREILQGLERKGHRLSSRCDTEILVHLYEEADLGLFDALDGMFAFAIWDAAKRRLLLARDRFGVKPLFYTCPDPEGRIAFASEIEPLLSVPGVDRSVDPIAIDRFVSLSYIPHPLTIYRGIRKLPPATCMVVEGGSATFERYWSPDLAPQYAEDGEALDDLDAALGRSVSEALRADVALGAFLSGGLDSGTVVYHMRRATRGPIRTYSLRIASSSHDESEQAREVSRRFATDHSELLASPADAARVTDLMRFFGEPFADPSLVPTFLISQAASRDVKVVLSGDGGDELLGGYPTYCASLLAPHARKIPAGVRDLIVSCMRRLPASMAHASFGERLRKFLKGCHLPPLERHAVWRLVFDAEERRRLYSRDFLEELGPEAEKHVFAGLIAWLGSDGPQDLTSCQILDLYTYLTDNNLAKVDRMSMANSLEVRVPFLSLSVLETALRVHPRMRVRGLRTKLALRRLMRGRLPASVLRMKKKGFTIPLGSWFRGPLKGFLSAKLSPERIRRLTWFRPEYIRQLVDQHFSGSANRSRQLWSLVCFLEWLEANGKA